MRRGLGCAPTRHLREAALVRWVDWRHIIRLVQVEGAFFELFFQLEDLGRSYEVILSWSRSDKMLTASMSASGPVKPSNNATLNVRIYRISNTQSRQTY